MRAKCTNRHELYDDGGDDNEDKSSHLVSQSVKMNVHMDLFIYFGLKIIRLPVVMVISWGHNWKNLIFSIYFARFNEESSSSTIIR